ncbi:hypothetical protein NK638_00015 [Psychrobacter sp. A3]|nr:hypothetical protein [Psychrobacter sp. A3]MDE0489945.1 hypothetical protein [Psychrobacter sp. A3]
MPVLSAHLPKEASACALGLYQQERAREQLQWQSQQGVINQQRRREGLDIPNGEAVDSDNDEDQADSNDAQSRADTWYDRAVEWF